MKTVKLILSVVLFLISMNCHILIKLSGMPLLPTIFCYIFSIILFIVLNIFSSYKKSPSFRLTVMDGGRNLIIEYFITITINIAANTLSGIFLFPGRISTATLIINCIISALFEVIVFLNGMIRIFCTSVQLGIKWRLIIAFLWWVPIINIFVIIKTIKLVSCEYRFEVEKYELDNIRVEGEICNTKYPILLVHGVFFRDSSFFNYWGRIPGELKKNGAVIFYGEQESAASVIDSGRELAKKIESIVLQSGCGKVNIIAHSKGGLDARYAISCLGSDKYAASLTTINTPHHGCIFAEQLLNKAPAKLRSAVANTYNSALKRFGDSNPDFMAAVTDLTVSACGKFNKNVLDADGVFYQSIMSKAIKSTSGKFPLNISYPLVRHYDGENDGLVSVESAKWGSSFTLVSVKGKRGVTHGDMIDLNRENIDGFDVREFYVQLVSKLKQYGY